MSADHPTLAKYFPPHAPPYTHYYIEEVTRTAVYSEPLQPTSSVACTTPSNDTSREQYLQSEQYDDPIVQVEAQFPCSFPSQFNEKSWTPGHQNLCEMQVKIPYRDMTLIPSSNLPSRSPAQLHSIARIEIYKVTIPPPISHLSS